MDEFFGLRAEMEAAIRQDDAARDRYDRFERKWAEREQAQARTEIVYKTFESKPAKQQRSAAVMDAQTDARWNEWFEQSFINAAERWLIPAAGDAMGDLIAELRKEFEKELGQIRGELEILRAHKASNDVVTSIRNRDAA